VEVTLGSGLRGDAVHLDVREPNEYQAFDNASGRTLVFANPFLPPAMAACASAARGDGVGTRR
jgi:hypothetical protein